jgi:hypothetical protein
MVLSELFPGLIRSIARECTPIFAIEQAPHFLDAKPGDR